MLINNNSKKEENSGLGYMELFALQGHKVKLCEDCLKPGTSDEAKELRGLIKRKVLEFGKEYTIHHTDVESMSTYIVLEEYPQLYLNNIFFESILEQSELDDMKHKDYYRFNERKE